MEASTIRAEVPAQAAKLTLAIWASTFLLFLMPQFVATGRMPSFVVGAVAVTVVVGCAVSALLYLACARLQDTPRPLKRMGVFAAICGCAFAFSLFDSWLGGEILRLFMGAHRVKQDVVNMTVSNFISFSWLYGLLGTLYVILQTSAAVRERDQQLAEARALAQTAQLTALRLQLNPHFLFNTLNAISSLIVAGRNRDGEAMLSKLCAFLRTALMSDGKGDGTLGDELETLQTYLEIEAIRFGDRLTVEFACPDDLLDVPLPTFLLQPLVENAVKHAVAPTSRPVLVRIAARREGRDVILSVSDNGGGRPVAGTGVGLANTRRRIEMLYGARARLETMPHDTGFLAVIRLPLPDKAATLGLVA
jgi:signal transduction histidine kinase